MSKKMHALPKTLSAFIFYFVKQQRGRFGFIFLSGMAWSVNESLYPYFVKVLVDKIAKLTTGLHAPFHVLAWPLIGLAIAWLCMAITERARNIVSIYTWPRFRKNIRENLLAYTQGQSHSYFSEHLTGGLANKITELPRACEHILTIVIENFFYTTLTFCISLAIVFQVSAMFGGILLGFVIIFMAMTILNIRNINNKAKIHAEALSIIDGQIVDSLSCMLAVRLFARSNYELEYLDRYQTDEMKKSERASWAIQKVTFFQGFFSFIFMIITFCVLVYGWNHNWVSIGDFSLITTSFFNLVGLIWHSSFHITQIAKEIGVAKAALSLLNEPYNIKNYPNARPLFITKGTIYFNKVTFHYTPELNVFNQLSVKIEGGQKVGLVGYSGSGKTTFMNLILRLYDLHSGKILIDNQNIANVTQESLREQIAVIPQDPVLFHRTIFENIHYGCLNATDEEVLEAARLAHCDEFVQHLDHGFKTMIGEHGVKLSGGQRQRIAIARAILKNAPILIMDEATAALDSVTEKMIQDSLKDLMKHCTALVIAHRLSTLNYMDHILVFHKGAIIENGTLSELLAQKGHFAQLWEMQVNGFLADPERT